MKKLLWLIPLVLICGCATAAPILQQLYTTNTVGVVDAHVNLAAATAGTNAAADLLGYVNGDTNGGSANFFVGNAGNSTVVSGGNIGIGQSALNGIMVGPDNVGVGVGALDILTNGQSNTAIGHHSFISLLVGDSNIGIGINSGSSLTNGSSNIYIGNTGVGNETNNIRIGNLQTDFYLAGSSTTSHVAYITGNGFGLTNTPKIFTVTNTSPANTTSLAQATIWLVITNQGVAYKVPAF